MQRIIQINITGNLIPIEEDAYTVLKNYLNTLEHHFANERGNFTIIQDVESRIAELFQIRLQTGTPAIDREDVRVVIDKLGQVGGYANGSVPSTYVNGKQAYSRGSNVYRRLYRNPYDKIIGGVCGGLGSYFDVDPVIIRLVFATCFLLAGVGLLIYLAAWIIIPVARTQEELSYMETGEPMNIHDIAHNMSNDLQDLKKKGEEMSKELRAFFSKRK